MTAEPTEGMEVVIINGDRNGSIFFDTVTHVTKTAFVTQTGRRFSRADRRETSYTRWPATVYLPGGDGWDEANSAYRVAKLRAAASAWGKRVSACPTDPATLTSASRQLARIADLLEEEESR